jgi:DmsE family decaheme c-type cytochrome
MRALSARLALFASLVPLAANAANYVGSEACQKCHPDIWSKFNRNAHFRAYARASQPSPGTGCESCHGPASDHIASMAKKDIFAFSLRSASEITDRCLTCHGGDSNRANLKRSEHFRAGVACTACHSIHHSATATSLLANEERVLCYGCHPTVRAQFSMPFKHRVNEGFMTCTDCHNPHGAFAPTWRMAGRPHMVSQSLGNEEPCLGCHVEFRGPFVFEHASIRVDGCEVCHMPHGSTNARLLKRPVVFTLCLECHNGSGTGRSGNGPPVTSPAHNLADPRYQNCTGCHVRIHGSNSDALFLR